MPKRLPIRIEHCMEWMGCSSPSLSPHQSDDKDNIAKDNDEDVAVSAMLAFTRSGLEQYTIEVAVLLSEMEKDEGMEDLRCYDGILAVCK